jgi:hypothetical protein
MSNATDTRIASAAAFWIAKDSWTEMAREALNLQKNLFSIWHESNSREDKSKLMQHERRMQRLGCEPLATCDLLLEVSNSKKEKEQAKEQILFCEWYDAWYQRADFWAAKEEEKEEEEEKDCNLKKDRDLLRLAEAADKAWDELKRFQANGMTRVGAVFVGEQMAYEKHWRKLLALHPKSDPVESVRSPPDWTGVQPDWSDLHLQKRLAARLERLERLVFRKAACSQTGAACS